MPDAVDETPAGGWPPPINAHLAHRLLSSALSSSALIEAWRHPLGFIHVRLGEADGVRLRLHIWPEAPETPSSDQAFRIHNHAFRFRSRVLSGRIAHRPYAVTIDPEGDHRLFEIHQVQGGAEVRATAQICRAAKEVAQILTEGDEYLVEAGTFHDAIALEAFTTTLVLAHPVPDVRSFVVGYRGSQSRSVAWIPIDRSRFRTMLESLLAHLEQGPGNGSADTWGNSREP